MNVKYKYSNQNITHTQHILTLCSPVRLYNIPIKKYLYLRQCIKWQKQLQGNVCSYRIKRSKSKI